MSDPICHIPPTTEIGQPQPKAIQAIPPAQPNIASLTATVNALRMVVQQITGQNPLNPNLQPNTAGFNRVPDKSGGNNGKPQWSEQGRTTNKVKIFQDNDKNTGNFVEVEQINTLTMVDKNTGQTWKWTR